MQTPGWGAAPSDVSYVDMRDYVQVIRRRRNLILLITATLVALAILWTTTQTAVYTARAELLVKEPLPASTATTLGPLPTLNIENERAIMGSLPVAAIAEETIGLDENARQLLERLEVVVPKDADVLRVQFQHSDPRVAAQGAQAFANAYLTYKEERAQADIDEQIATLTGAIEAATGVGNDTEATALRQRQAELQATIPDAGDILLEAVPPGSPTSPNLPLNVGLALFLGLFIGLVAAFIRERVNDRLRGRGDLEETIGAPVMTQIPAVPAWRNRADPHLVTIETPKSPAAEAYRTLRTSVLVTAAQQGIKTLMVVSAVAGEGKTTTASNLAVVLAQADKRVVLISADLRRPRLHDYFGLPPSDRGLSEVLSGSRRPWEALRSGKVENLWIMSSGKISEQPTELLQSEAMRELLTDQREVVDFILIDCPPVLAVADALVLVPMVDGVLYVADAQTTPRGAVLQARAQLDQVGAQIVGAVLNDVEGASGYAYYGQYTYQPDPAANGANGKGRVWPRRSRDRASS
jgi:succinoglycan biosynthesis transport protein ExoP